MWIFFGRTLDQERSLPIVCAPLSAIKANCVDFPTAVRSLAPRLELFIMNHFQDKLGAVARAGLFGLLCTGCDTLYGVSHFAPRISIMPSDACVIEALQSIPAMLHVSSRVETGSSPLTWHGIESPDQIHRFFYEYNGIRGSLFISVSYKKRVDYHHDYLYIHQRPPQAVIDRLYPAFSAVDEALDSECGIPDLGSKVQESCNGVRCRGA
jgi:hypothetical protein